MSIGFVVGAMVLCAVFGLEKLAKLFGIILWIGLTIANPGLIFLWIGIAVLIMAARK